MPRLPALLVLVTTFLVAACSTIVSGTQQTVFIDTPEVTGASCQLHDSKSGTWYLPSTPGPVTVLKGNGPLHVTCKRDGYKTATTTVPETVAGATFGNIILGGGIGIFVDAASGAAQHYPDRILVWLEPNRWSSKAAREDWKRQQLAYLEELKKLQQGTDSAPKGGARNE